MSDPEAKFKMLLSLASESLKSERWDDSVRFASSVIEAGANGDYLFIALEVLAWAHISADRPDAALSVLSEALRMRSPGSIAPAIDLSRKLSEKGRAGDAYHLLAQAHQCAPHDVSVPLVLAEIHRRSGSYPDAVRWTVTADGAVPSLRTTVP